MSRERPIIFSALMVRALLEDRKAQTRRAYKNRKHPDFGCDIAASEIVREEQHVIDRTCPYGNPGDRLWVREAFSGPYCFEAKPGMGISARPPSKWGKSSPIHYWADGDPDHGDWTKPRPSIFMPRWASRITLEITGVRVERLQDISESDAEAEGTPHPYGGWIGGYQQLWESINGTGSWGQNPWVWVLEFKRVEQ